MQAELPAPELHLGEKVVSGLIRLALLLAEIDQNEADDPHEESIPVPAALPDCRRG